ncbi:nickel/cobalt efflux system [Aureimonas endophytica]|uniref:Nickel/cobalt efflux system n=1 Tax=Aureimonas endophytica TaxID=2027858 RepID=A0A917A4C9_9HYPH|nr:nickel/cobalt transporter [Aureimonas endophytica]GGE25259.1 nickel/cobalt efflux system [Aureimonas endophytica]
MRLKPPILLALFAAAGLALLAEPALAKSSLGIGTAESGGMPTGPFAGLFLEINLWQRQFLMSLNKALVAMKNGSGGAMVLVGLSFAYGIFHAAGPGHGKAVISSYLLADKVQLRRGILLSFVSSALQAVMAILVAGAGWFVLRGSGISMTDVSQWLETGSFALVAAFGLWLLARKLVEMARRPRRVRMKLDFAPPAAFQGTGGLAFASAASLPADPIMRPASGGFSADICMAEDDENCDCGRPHIADPARLGGESLSFSGAVSAVLAVGIRPCWGAVSVMAFALVNGLYGAGLVSVFAVSLGTAITVSAIAALTVLAKGVALRLGRAGGRSRLVLDTVEILGAVFVLLMGLMLLGGSLA